MAFVDPFDNASRRRPRYGSRAGIAWGWRIQTTHSREHALRSGRRDGLVFGATARRPLDSHRLQEHADEAWQARGLTRVTLHACRHLYASMSIAAGVNAHALCRYMGHSSIAVTFDLYGHLVRDNESEAAAFLDAYLEHVFVSSGNRIGSL
jgi:integrase